MALLLYLLQPLVCLFSQLEFTDLPHFLLLIIFNWKLFDGSASTSVSLRLPNSLSCLLSVHLRNLSPVLSWFNFGQFWCLLWSLRFLFGLCYVILRSAAFFLLGQEDILYKFTIFESFLKLASSPLFVSLLLLFFAVFFFFDPLDPYIPGIFVSVWMSLNFHRFRPFFFLLLIASLELPVLAIVLLNLLEAEVVLLL